ncbi:hypothetical protein [Oceanobacillus kimchii]|uniref:hypothetical protein n=1 Tax=Oceanobacillus kimchii TaxID=746691 RepID=UPI00034A36C0|nr:hypothetical protein [Oceanobacillus kimchii]
MFKKLIITFMIVLVSITTVLPNVSAATKQNDDLIDFDDLEEVDLTTVTNLDEALGNVGITRDNLLDNNYKVISENVSFINAKNTENNRYYNFYLEGNEIKYYSVQAEKDNGNATFELYDMSNIFILSSEVDKYGNVVKEETYMDRHPENDGIQLLSSSGINKAAFKWACIFSSYIACLAVAAAAGAAGALVSGPFGVAAGFAGGNACRYLFQTAVDKYGGKDKACKVLS